MEISKISVTDSATPVVTGGYSKCCRILRAAKTNVISMKKEDKQQCTVEGAGYLAEKLECSSNSSLHAAVP